MNIQVKFILLWALIILPFLGGSFLRRSLSHPGLAAKFLIRINLIIIEPVILFWTIWGMKIHSDVAFLPLAGLGTAGLGFICGKLMLRFMKLKGVSADSYLISSILANQGMTMGGLICYIIAGEQGLALATIYVVYYLPFVFTFIFPFAKYSSVRHKMKEESVTRNRFRDFTFFFFNLQNLPLASIIAALIVNLLNLQRPEVWFPLDPLLFAAILIYYLTLGINFQTGHIKSGFREQAALASSKFILIPLITFAILSITDLDPLVKTVIQVQSFMPAAVYSVISSILFDLDAKLTSGLFVVNSLLFLGIVLPVLMVLRGVI